MMLEKYANLLLSYCLSVNEGDHLYIKSTQLATPLVREIYKQACQRGVVCEMDLEFQNQSSLYFHHSSDEHLSRTSPVQSLIVNSFDAYLYIRAPYNLAGERSIPQQKRQIRSKAVKEVNQTYSARTATGELRRTLCQYPTNASAQLAGMSLSEYEEFVFQACQLNTDDPIKSWQKIGESQQKIVDFLNQSEEIEYKNENTRIRFSVKDRIWINSDGKTNMPSGEVFTAPVEDSVNGHIHFDFPTMFLGKEVSGIQLEVEDGQVKSWKAQVGQEVLDQIFEFDGARYFGEVAIGTNYAIQQATRNILFDEKIGGTVHMAVGQSYLQTGGKNQSPIHWDMIADMKNGQILADGQLIYENGHFTEAI